MSIQDLDFTGCKMKVKEVYTAVLNGFSCYSDHSNVDKFERQNYNKLVACNKDGVARINVQTVGTFIPRLGVQNSSRRAGTMSPAFALPANTYGIVVDFTDLGSWYDENGHGTHVAGTIAGKCRVLGVAPGATVIALRVLDQDGFGDMMVFAKAVNYVGMVGKSGDVVNLSLGGPPTVGLDNAILQVAKKGIRFSIAAGNFAKSAMSYSPARVSATNIYTVSAMDDSNSLAWFSNWGNPPIDFAAPGVSITSLSMKEGSTAVLDGTSMAAPHVAGLLLVGNVIAKGTVKSDVDATPDAIAYTAFTPTRSPTRSPIRSPTRSPIRPPTLPPTRSSSSNMVLCHSTRLLVLMLICTVPFM